MKSCVIRLQQRMNQSLQTRVLCTGTDRTALKENAGVFNDEKKKDVAEDFEII